MRSGDGGRGAGRRSDGIPGCGHDGGVAVQLVKIVILRRNQKRERKTKVHATPIFLIDLDSLLVLDMHL